MGKTVRLLHDANGSKKGKKKKTREGESDAKFFTPFWGTKMSSGGRITPIIHLSKSTNTTMQDFNIPSKNYSHY